MRRRGGHVHPVTWNAPVDWADRHAFVAVRVAAALDEVTAATGVTAPVLIGKSLGSLAAPLAADRGLAAVWFTPLLTDERTLAALRRTSAPCLLVGGTADKHWWDGAAARSVTPHVVEIDGADHAMIVPGPLSASAAVLGQVMDAVEAFLDGVIGS
jgi:pimeloyl-ACP methyl ester carboxylesterase